MWQSLCKQHQASFHHHPCSRQLATYSESQILCAALHELRTLINIQSATHSGANDSGPISIGSKPETPFHTLNLSNLGRTSGQFLKEFHHHSQVCLRSGYEDGFAHLQVLNVTRLIDWRKRRSKDVVTVGSRSRRTLLIVYRVVG